MTARRFRGDRGQAAIELPLGFALILLPVAVVVMVVPQWPERQTVATAAAKEAATLYATAASPAEGAAAAAGRGRPGRRRTTGCDGLQLELSGSWCRGCTVTANVTVDDPRRAGAAHRHDRRRRRGPRRRRRESRTTPR